MFVNAKLAVTTESLDRNVLLLSHNPVRELRLKSKSTHIIISTSPEIIGSEMSSRVLQTLLSLSLPGESTQGVAN